MTSEQKADKFTFREYPRDLEPMTKWLDSLDYITHIEQIHEDDGALVLLLQKDRTRVGTIVVPPSDITYEQTNHIYYKASLEKRK